jgi:CheY-like chemotaxis protein
LSNAVKFTPEGGKIGLEVECNPELLNVRFTVWDTGIGIAEDDLTKLFRPFTQLDSSLSRQQSGTGLGLTLVQRMVELHGGSVSLESAPGKGSRFSVSLPWESGNYPVQGGSMVEESENIIQHTPNTSRPLILLVDDNEINLMVYSDYLLSRGYRLELAYNGEGGVRLAQECKPDLIIMDIQMPGMDGLEAIRQIRNAGLTRVKSTVILALTALAMPGDRQRCLDAGADEYISKPVSLKKLASVIQELLGAYKQ